jgi:hypothetical protein
MGGESEIVIQAMAGPGLELILGLRHENGFGNVIVAGLGGIFVELVQSVSVRLAPVDLAEAHEMLRECRAAELLAGFRGRGPFDREAAAEAVVALSTVGAGAEFAFGAIEINPLIVGRRGAVGVDVLVVPAAAQ